MGGYGCRTTSFASGRPLLLLTAKQSEKDKIAGYESGADGYLIKPFGLSLPHARIKSLLKNRERIARDFHPRHGTIIPVTADDWNGIGAMPAGGQSIRGRIRRQVIR